MIVNFRGATADAAWRHAALALVQGGDGVRTRASRMGDVRELLHVSVVVDDPTDRCVTSRTPPINLAFALAEVIWILLGRDDLRLPTYFNSGYPRFVGTAPRVHGAYGYRLRRHLGVDQLRRAALALRENPDSRQVVLQLWDGRVDLPDEAGRPASPDVPCNLVSMLKVRDGVLDWTQVMRSNDVFRGLPYNLIQFTSLQELIAGWAGVAPGRYIHVADSLHAYRADLEVFAVGPAAPPTQTRDPLKIPLDAFDSVAAELDRRVDAITENAASPDAVAATADWPDAPRSIQNILRVLGAYSLRKRRATRAADELMSSCSNQAYCQLWRLWQDHVAARPRSSGPD